MAIYVMSFFELFNLLFRQHFDFESPTINAIAEISEEFRFA